MDFNSTFESKGVLDAQQRLSRVSGDVREPFPDAVSRMKCETTLVRRLSIMRSCEHHYASDFWHHLCTAMQTFRLPPAYLVFL